MAKGYCGKSPEMGDCVTGELAAGVGGTGAGTGVGLGVFMFRDPGVGVGVGRSVGCDDVKRLGGRLAGKLGGMEVGPCAMGALEGVGVTIGISGRWLSPSILNSSSLTMTRPVSCESSGVMIKITDPAAIRRHVTHDSVKALLPLDMKVRLNPMVMDCSCV